MLNDKLPFMLSMDQIQCELKAIEEFDAVFLAETEAGKEEMLEDALGQYLRNRAIVNR